MRRWPWEERDTWGKCHRMTKAKMGVMQLQAEECQRLPANPHKLPRGKEGFPYRFQRKHHPDFSLQDHETINFFYFKPHSLWYFIKAALGKYYKDLTSVSYIILP